MLLNTETHYTPEQIESFRLNKPYKYPPDYIPSEDKIIKRWQEQYKLAYNGIYTEDYVEIAKLRKIQLEYYSSIIYNANADIGAINEAKNNCIMLGWDPNRYYYYTNKAKCNAFNIDAKIIDLSVDSYIQESKVQPLKPLYIVLSFTNTAFGKAITNFTNSKYSHAALALDAKLDKLYTFNADVNGFKIESLKEYKKAFDESLLAVYTVMVNPKSYNKVKNAIENYILKAKATSYSFLTGLGVVLGVPIIRNDSMICSQFVDSMLKMINVEAIKKDSALVVPGDFSNSKILYKVFEGHIKNYKPSVVLANLNKRFNLEEATELVTEAKEFPAGFDKDGNLIIRNMKKLNYEEEYQKSHKLLKAYKDSGNHHGEAAAFELSKLWFLNTEIEKKIFHSNISESEKEALFKTRTRILNDFNAYMKLLLQDEKDFNFTEYYNNTPFSDVSVKIDKYTIKYGLEYGKSILKNLIL